MTLAFDTSGSRTFFMSSGLACFSGTIWVTTRSLGPLPSARSRVSMLFSLACWLGTILITSPEGTVVRPWISRTDSKTR